MRPYLVLALATALLASAAPSHAADSPTPRIFLGAGATGTPAFGFQGGWNIGGGVEAPLSKACHLVLRADYQTLPNANDDIIGLPIFYGPANALGKGDSSVPHASLFSVATGLRLSGPTRPFQIYADALVGVGHLSMPRGPIYASPAMGISSEPGHDETNVMLSFGAGARFLSVAGYGLFSDVHYDFYYLEQANEPVIPIRFGIALP